MCSGEKPLHISYIRLPTSTCKKMKMKPIHFLYTLNLILVCSSVCHIWAKTPETPKIAFVSTRDGQRDIYLMNPDGTQQDNLTGKIGDNLYPAWSPTGQQILFTSKRNRTRDLYLMDADGENVKHVFRKSAHREHPTWSPDGKQIAYERVELGQRFIYIATIDGENETQITSGRYPDWSPDGTQIAFANGGLGGSQIVLWNVNTRTEKPLIQNIKKMPWMRWPAWSTAGDRIAFSWNKNPLPDPPDPWPPEGWRVPQAWLDKETIYVANQDGTGLERVVDEAGPKATSPTWSPRGDELIYTQMINNHLQLFKIDLATRTPKQLTRMEADFQENTLANWFDPTYALPVSSQPQLLTTMWGKLKKK